MAAAVEIPVVENKVEGRKGVETFIKKQLALVQSRLDGVSGKVRGQVAGLRKTLGGLPQQTLGKVKAALKVERFDKIRALLAKAPFDKVEKAVADGQKFTEEAAQKLGLAKIADVTALKSAFDGLHKTIDQLKKRLDALVKAPEVGASEPGKE